MFEFIDKLFFRPEEGTFDSRILNRACISDESLSDPIHAQGTARSTCDGKSAEYKTPDTHKSQVELILVVIIISAFVRRKGFVRLIH